MTRVTLFVGRHDSGRIFPCAVTSALVSRSRSPTGCRAGRHGATAATRRRHRRVRRARGPRPSELIGAANVPKPSWATSARIRPQPRNTPRPMPPSVPKIATITDSQRTVERTSERVCPTARSRPSSRVRSWIDSDSVLAMPISAIRTARPSMPYTKNSIWSISEPRLSTYSDRVCASGAAFRAVTALTAARPSASDTPSARSTSTTTSPSWSACGAQSSGVMIMSPTFMRRAVDARPTDSSVDAPSANDTSITLPMARSWSSAYSSLTASVAGGDVVERSGRHVEVHQRTPRRPGRRRPGRSRCRRR